MFRPCIIIPIYNHGRGLSDMVKALRSFQTPCLLIDDGSDQETKKILKELATESETFTLIEHPCNRGKGAAVMTGISAALERGFTHGLQIDADGQHDLQDIPRFLGMAKTSPDAVIVGAPIYDESVPRHRFYFRYLTHVCVWVECLSRAIKDSMCGFRIFPLAFTQKVIQRVNPGAHMDFDAEILVRMYWAGVAVHNVSTRVTYQADGVSHFRLVRDNIRISWMHTRLLLGMLLRSPMLLRRRLMNRDKHWSEREERGAFWCLKFILLLYRCGGKWLCKALVYPIVLYFYLTGRKARAASLKYLQRLYDHDPVRSGFKKRPGQKEVFLHCLTFGKSLLIRLGAWLGELGRWDLEWENRYELLDFVDKRKGAVIMGGHLGNMEVMRAVISPHPQMKYNALSYTDHAPRINRLFKLANPKNELNLVSVRAFSPETAIALKECIDRGEFVVIMGDRVAVGARDRTLKASFLGHKAPFPVGPFLLMSLLTCPVFNLFCVQNAAGTHQVTLDQIEDKALILPRQEREARLREVIQAYANQLEDMCYIAPYQWFNFFDFWNESDTT